MVRGVDFEIRGWRRANRDPHAAVVTGLLSPPMNTKVRDGNGLPPDDIRASSADSSWLYRMYSAFGGVVTGDELAKLRELKAVGSVATIARWIVRREVVNFTWHSQILVPLFQFETGCLEPRAGLDAVLAELLDIYDDQEVSQWFARPSLWLDDELPLALIANYPTRVTDAARADRFALRG